MSLAPHPTTPLESHSCISQRSNSPRITFLRKNHPGGGGVPSAGRSAIDQKTDSLSTSVLSANPVVNLAPLAASPIDVVRLGDWIHLPPNKMQQSRLPRRSTIHSPHPNSCHPERSGVLCGSARLLRDESAFCSPSVTAPPLANPQLTRRASFPILLLQMNPRVHRHHHHHGTAPRLMRYV